MSLATRTTNTALVINLADSVETTPDFSNNIVQTVHVVPFSENTDAKMQAYPSPQTPNFDHALQAGGWLNFVSPSVGKKHC